MVEGDMREPLNFRLRLQVFPDEAPDLWERLKGIPSARMGDTVFAMLNRLVAYERILITGGGIASISPAQVVQGAQPGALASDDVASTNGQAPVLTSGVTPIEVEQDPVKGLMDAFGPSGLTGFLSRDR